MTTAEVLAREEYRSSRWTGLLLLGHHAFDTCTRPDHAASSVRRRCWPWDRASSHTLRTCHRGPVSYRAAGWLRGYYYWSTSSWVLSPEVLTTLVIYGWTCSCRVDMIMTVLRGHMLPRVVDMDTFVHTTFGTDHSLPRRWRVWIRSWMEV
jgi:hypothetical protein